jgi:hypothetical protein
VEVHFWYIVVQVFNVSISEKSAACEKLTFVVLGCFPIMLKSSVLYNLKFRDCGVLCVGPGFATVTPDLGDAWGA